MLLRGGRQAAPPPRLPSICDNNRHLSCSLRLGVGFRGLSRAWRPVVSPCPRQFPGPQERTVLTSAVGTTAKANTKKKQNALQRAKRSLQDAPARPEPTLVGPPFNASPEQQLAIDAVIEGRNLFLTGCAGTGKSATLVHIRSQLLLKYGSKEEYEKRVAVVAMTGLAATIVGGVTLHSLLKLGLTQTFSDFDRMLEDEEVQRLLRELHTLVLDEAGMMSAELLQALDHYLTVARKRTARNQYASGEISEEEMERLLTQYDRPFGGLQLILSGDFFQLAPIKNKAHPASANDHTPGSHRSKHNPSDQVFWNRGFMFEAPVFYYGGFTVVELTQVFRQGEQDFVDLLNAVRCGSEDESRKAVQGLLVRCSRPLDPQDDIRPTLLFSMNAPVLKRNEEELAELPGKTISFSAVDEVYVTHEPPGSVYAPLSAEGLLTVAELEDLKKDLDGLEPVMGLHEARLKKLVGPAAKRAVELRDEWRQKARDLLYKVAKDQTGLFKNCQAAPKVHLKEGAQVMLVRNVDLDSNLVNGSRGVVERFEDMDEEYMRSCIALATKVEIQRVMHGAKAEVEGCNWEMERWLNAATKVPVVKFADGRRIELKPAVFTAVVPGYGVCVRVQIPMKLAWAITVHKSQGMTLDRASINLNDFFGHGMLYTALSRVKGLEGLHLQGNAQRKMDPRVLLWWARFRSGQPWTPSQPASEGPWCWQDDRQPYLSQPQNPQAELWFFEGPAAFFAWQKEDFARLAVERQQQMQEAALRQAEERVQGAAAAALWEASVPETTKPPADPKSPRQLQSSLADASADRGAVPGGHQAGGSGGAGGAGDAGEALAHASTAHDQLDYLRRRTGAVKKAELDDVLHRLRRLFDFWQLGGLQGAGEAVRKAPGNKPLVCASSAYDRLLRLRRRPGVVKKAELDDALQELEWLVQELKSSQARGWQA